MGARKKVKVTALLTLENTITFMFTPPDAEEPITLKLDVDFVRQALAAFDKDNAPEGKNGKNGKKGKTG